MAVVKPPVSGAAMRVTNTSIEPPIAPYAALMAKAPDLPAGRPHAADRGTHLAVAQGDQRPARTGSSSCSRRAGT